MGFVIDKSPAEMQHAIALRHRMLNGLCIIRLPITHRTKSRDIAHGEKLPAHPHTVNYPMACNRNPNKD